MLPELMSILWQLVVVGHVSDGTAVSDRSVLLPAGDGPISVALTVTGEPAPGTVLSWYAMTPSGVVEKTRDEMHLELSGPGAAYVTVARFDPVTGEVRQGRFEMARGATYSADQWSRAFAADDSDPAVTVALLDSGVNPLHPLLVGRLVPGGYDFIEGDADPADDMGHGTAIAGLIATTPSARILPVKVTDAFGSSPAAAVAAGIRHAVAAGARIVVMAFGTADTVFRDTIEPALREAAAAQVLVVTTAGNRLSPVDLDTTDYFPATMLIGPQLVVGAVDSAGTVAPYSNFGAHAVHVWAYGGAGTASDPGPRCADFRSRGENTQRPMRGTSFAAPVVAALAAQIMASDPALTAEETRQRIMDLGSRGPLSVTNI